MYGEAVFLRCRKKSPIAAWVAIIVGALVLLALLLPRWLWWLLSGAALIVGGILLLKK